MSLSLLSKIPMTPSFFKENKPTISYRYDVKKMA